MFKQGLVAVAALALVGVFSLTPDQAVAVKDEAKGDFLCHFDKNNTDVGKLIWVTGTTATGSLGNHLNTHNFREGIGDDYLCVFEGDLESGASCTNQRGTTEPVEVDPLDCDAD